MLYLLFDFWRTLVDPPDLDDYYRYRVRNLLRVEGIEDPMDIERAFLLYRRIFDLFDSRRRASGIEIPATLEIEIFLNCLGVRELKEEHMEAYASPMLDLTVPKPGVREMLEELVSEGYKLAIVSNTPYHEMIVAKLEKEGLLDFFEVVVSSHRVGVRKPNRRIFEYALESLGGRPTEAVMIGDSPYEDVMGAKRMGMLALWVFWEGTSASLADGIVKSLDEVPKLLKVIA